MKTIALTLALALMISIATPDQAMALPVTLKQSEAISQMKWVYGLMPRWIAVCLNSQTECHLNPNELKVLSQIFSSAWSERQNTRLNFISASQNLGHFEFSHAAHRFAVTGNQVGDAIDLNTDSIDSLSMGDMVALLTHELGHHQGYLDTDDRILDQVGSKVRLLFEARTQVTHLRGADPSDSFQLFVNNSGLPEESMKRGQVDSYHFEDYPQVWTLANGHLQDFSDRMQAREWCSHGGWLTRVGLYDLHANRDVSLSSPASFALSGTVKWMCSTAPGTSGPSLIHEAIDLKIDFHQTESNTWAAEPSIHYHPSQGPDHLEKALASITSWKSKKDTVKNGEVWRFEAMVESKIALDIFTDCHIILASDSLHETFAAEQLGSCKLRPVFSVDKNIIEVDGEFRVPEITESRKYYVQSLVFRGFHDFNTIVKVAPPIRQGLEVISSQFPANVNFVSLTIESRRDGGVEKTGLHNLSWQEGYVLRLKSRNSGHFLSSRLVTQVHQIDPEQTIEASYDPAEPINMSHYYHFGKFSGDTIVEEFHRMEVYDSSIPFREHNRMDVSEIDFVRFSWLNTQLQETTVDFKPGELGLRFRPGYDLSGGGVDPF